MTVIRYECTGKYGKSHPHALVDVPTRMSAAYKGQLGVMCPECGRKMKGSFVT